MGQILVADDEDGIRDFLAEALTSDGHDVIAVGDGAAALAALREGGLDVIVTDLRMPGVEGMDVVRAARTEQPDVEVIVLTAFGGVATAVESLKLGAFDYLEKPLSSPNALRARVAAALERRRQIVGRASEPDALSPGPALASRAPSMAPVVVALQKVARTGATVLLQGESGTGKEVAARAIHATSPRRDRPFVAINCAVLSESLIESELFGHEKGAFTGAHALRRGRIELADGGTFFLDEVGDLHPSLQAKLLRVLEERSFERLGGSTTVVVDVRWIAATHKDLRAMVRDGAFREDLYHRLAVFPITLRPLRERREDILPIAETLLRQLAAPSRAPATLDPAAKARLALAPWPGNIRELRNAIERALILADGGVVRADDLWLDGEVPSATPLPVASAESTLADLERQAILTALAAVGGNRRAAAERLGIGLRTLYEKLKRYGA